jgi:hypothetical protein
LASSRAFLRSQGKERGLIVGCHGDIGGKLGDIGSQLEEDSTAPYIFDLDMTGFTSGRKPKYLLCQQCESYISSI